MFSKIVLLALVASAVMAQQEDETGNYNPQHHLQYAYNPASELESHPQPGQQPQYQPQPQYQQQPQQYQQQQYQQQPQQGLPASTFNFQGGQQGFPQQAQPQYNTQQFGR